MPPDHPGSADQNSGPSPLQWPHYHTPTGPAEEHFVTIEVGPNAINNDPYMLMLSYMAQQQQHVEMPSIQAGPSNF